MAQKSKILFNPTNKTVDFQWAHKTYSLKPGEKRLFDGHLVYHALYHVNTGLVEYEPDEEGNMPESTSGLAYDKMLWKELVSLGSKEGLFKPGMKKAKLIKLLQEKDE